MRRKDKERDEAFAWQVLRDAEYGVLAVCDGETPYCVPVNHVADEDGRAVYFHCAAGGRKWEILKNEPPVCFTAVSYASLVPEQLTTDFNSAVLHGRARIVRDEAEKLRALHLLVERLDPAAIAKGECCGADTIARTAVVKLEVSELTGKQSEHKRA